MRFIVLLLTYILQRRFELTLSRMHDEWVEKFLSIIERQFPIARKQGFFYLFLAVLFPSLLLFTVLALLENFAFGFFTLFFHVVILFFCLGCGFLKEGLTHYTELLEAGAARNAFSIMEKSGFRLKNAQFNSDWGRHRYVCGRYIYLTFEKYFMIIFWYMVAGPVGALFVRLTRVASDHRRYAPPLLLRINLIVEWIPARLLALTFYLAGDFRGAAQHAFNELLDPAVDSHTLLDKTAAGGLDSYPESVAKGAFSTREALQQLEGIRGLLNRGIIIWFLILAAITILWVF